MLATLSETFWILVLAVVVLFAFFVALGAFSPGEVAGLTAVVVRARGALDRPRRVGTRATATRTTAQSSAPASAAGSRAHSRSRFD